MAKDTKRDRVWKAVIELGEEPKQHQVRMAGHEFAEIKGFTKTDIKDKLEIEVSDRTINDVIMTMRKYNIIGASTWYTTSVEKDDSWHYQHKEAYRLKTENNTSDFVGRD